MESITPNEQLLATPKNTPRLVSEDDYRLLQILKAAQESGRVLVNYPPDGKVKGWVLIFNGEGSAKEVRTNG